MDQAKLINQKLDGALRGALSAGGNEPLQVIVQTKDGLKEEDERLVTSLGGRVR